MLTRENGFKTKRSYYTQEKLCAAKENLQKTQWAKDDLNAVVQMADHHLALGLDKLWHAIPGQKIPRAAATNMGSICPVCGKQAQTKGNYPWDGFTLTNPWKIQCQNCHSVFPSNDFEAYHKSGLDEKGEFEPSLADRSLLVNQLYPDKPADFGVDDGYGWVDEKGEKFLFAAYYAHWMVWMYNMYSECGEGTITDALGAMRDAYLLTEDEKYARAGIVILDRIADIYPSLTLAPYRYEDGYMNCWGVTGKGKALGCIWESQPLKLYLTAFDAFTPILQKENETVLRFLHEKKQQYPAIQEKRSMREISKNIEENIVRKVFPMIKACELYGNVGVHQSALALAAVIYDGGAESDEWIRWIFQPGGLVEKPDFHVTGGDLNNVLYRHLDRDGFGNESSPDYNYFWVGNLKIVADILDGYKGVPEADLYRNPRFKKMFSGFNRMILNNAYMPHIGDTSRTGDPGFAIKRMGATQVADAYGRYRDPDMAALAYTVNGNSTSGLHSDWFCRGAEDIAAGMEAAAKQKKSEEAHSDDLTGFGLGVLRGNTQAAFGHCATISYGRTFWHGHRDSLNLELYGYGINLTPDLGYPEYATTDCRHRVMWSLNTVAHNTVMMDSRKQQMIYSGLPHGFFEDEAVRFSDVSSTEVYPQAQEYRRAIAMVCTGEQSCYYLDIFRVKGGKDYHYSFHTAEADGVETQGLCLTKQSDGTYAGETVAFEQQYDNNEPLPIYHGSGFQYLTEVSRDAAPHAGVSVDWKLKDTWGVWNTPRNVHLKLQMLQDATDVALAEGTPPRNKEGNPKKLPYFMEHQVCDPTETATFVHLIEPYENTSRIASAQCVPVHSGNADGKAEQEAVAVKLQMKNGDVEYLFYSADEGKQYAFDAFTVTGSFAFVRCHNNKPAYACAYHASQLAFDGTALIEGKEAAVHGTVLSFEQACVENATLLVQTEKDVCEAQFANKYVYIDNGYAQEGNNEVVEIPAIAGYVTAYKDVRNAAYKILQAKQIAPGKFCLTTDAPGFMREMKEDGSFLYEFAANSSFCIPQLYRFGATV